MLDELTCRFRLLWTIGYTSGGSPKVSWWCYRDGYISRRENMEVIRKMCRMLGTGWFLCFWFHTTPLHYTADSSFTMINVDKPSPQSTRSNMSKPETSPVGACRCCSSTGWQNWFETRRRWEYTQEEAQRGSHVSMLCKFFREDGLHANNIQTLGLSHFIKMTCTAISWDCSQQSKISEVINSFGRTVWVYVARTLFIKCSVLYSIKGSKCINEQNIEHHDSMIAWQRIKFLTRTALKIVCGRLTNCFLNFKCYGNDHRGVLSSSLVPCIIRVL